MSAQSSPDVDMADDNIESSLLAEADNAINRFQPASDEAYRQWPSLPRQLPRSGAASVVQNTSLDPDAYGNSEATDANEAILHGRVQALLQERAEREAQIAEQLEMQRLQQEAAVHAEEIAASLRELEGSFSAITTAFAVAMDQFKLNHPVEFTAFEAHNNCCRLTSRTMVEYFDKLRWYSHIPEYAFNALTEVARYYHRQAQLALAHNNFEIAAGAQGMEFGEDEQRAAEGDDIDENTDMTYVGFGLERDPTHHLLTVGEYRDRTFHTEQEGISYVRAYFNMVKTRLEQESINGLRFPSEKDFTRSLDNSFLAFTFKIMRDYIDGNGTIKPTVPTQLRNTLLVIQSYCEGLFNRRNAIESARRAIKDASQTLHNLWLKEADPDTPEERLPDIIKKIDEARVALDGDVGPLKQTLQQAIMLTVQTNPYAPLPVLDLDVPHNIA